MDLEVRASDEDRQRVVAELGQHTAAGRLQLGEFDERVAAALVAVTLGDLRALTRDLPDNTEGSSPQRQGNAGTAAAEAAAGRSLAIAFAIATLTLAVLGALLALAR